MLLVLRNVEGHLDPRAVGKALGENDGKVFIGILVIGQAQQGDFFTGPVVHGIPAGLLRNAEGDRRGAGGGVGGQQVNDRFLDAQGAEGAFIAARGHEFKGQPVIAVLALGNGKGHLRGIAVFQAHAFGVGHRQFLPGNVVGDGDAGDRLAGAVLDGINAFLNGSLREREACEHQGQDSRQGQNLFHG